jgi:hypothetical protein
MSNILIAVVVLAWVLSRQLSVRRLQERSRVGLILLLIGVIETAHFLSSHSLAARDVVLLIASAAVGCGLAVVRAFTVRIWADQGEVLRQGTVWTAALWLVSIGQHLLLDSLVSVDGLAQTSLLAYFGLVLLVQQTVLVDRARKYGHFPVAPGSQA